MNPPELRQPPATDVSKTSETARHLAKLTKHRDIGFSDYVRRDRRSEEKSRLMVDLRVEMGGTADRTQPISWCPLRRPSQGEGSCERRIFPGHFTTTIAHSRPGPFASYLDARWTSISDHTPIRHKTRECT
jgi:hypothetical protein